MVSLLMCADDFLALRYQTGGHVSGAYTLGDCEAAGTGI